VDDVWKGIVGRQLGAAVDMLEAAMVACPEPLWCDRERRPEFWYVAYHTLFYLDLYLAGSPEGFAPPAPFTLDELDPRGVLPDRPYTKAELRRYLDHGRARYEESVSTLSAERASEPCGFPWLDMTVAELFVYNLRHVQHHAAQLNLILRQTTRSSPGWISGV
jgi:hypothetical protein